MKTVYDGFSPLENIPHSDTCFIGANTGRGFLTLSEPLSEEGLARLYIIKGGAGTGKSSLMKKAAEGAVKRGIPVTAFLCGSDPDSFDAVVLGGKIGITDGTFPHVREMKYPAAVSSIVDLSRFLDGDKLSERRGEIAALSEKKTSLYRAAYSYLKATETVESERMAALRDAVEWEKLRAWAARTAKALCGREVRRGLNGTPRKSTFYTSSITMKGAVSLPAFERKANTVWGVQDSFGIAHLLLRALGDACMARGLSAEYGLIPVGDRIKEVYFPEIRTLFSAAPSSPVVKTVNAARFLQKDWVKASGGRMRFTGKCMDAMLGEAVSLLAQAGEAHFALERINMDAMDFDALREYSDGVVGEIMAAFEN
ncbi:MAG: hypothetical protein E7638_07370 [Ruminococcaceae bacterium]|nr:hypothetical protein [Oscillospiraceae bacterium]